MDKHVTPVVVAHERFAVCLEVLVRLQKGGFYVLARPVSFLIAHHVRSYIQTNAGSTGPDRRLLEQTAERHGLTPPVAWRCAMQAEATTRDGPDGDRAPWMKLTEAATRLRVPVTGAHNALADVRATLAVARALVGDNPA